MYITELHIQDLKCYAGEQRLSLARPDGSYAGWTVFAGRNGAGKTTLLKAIALACAGPLAGYALEGTFPRWVREGQTEARFATKLAHDFRDQFQKSGKTAQTPFWTGLRWSKTEGSTDKLDRWLELAVPNRRKTPDRGPWADAPQGWFITAYGPYRHLGPTTAEVERLSKKKVHARLVNLFNEAATLSEAVDWLRLVHLRALEGRDGAALLRDDVLTLLNDGLLPDGSRADRIDSDGLWVERDGVTLPLEHVSDGYRTTTALVIDLVRHLHETYGELSLTVAGGEVRCDLPGVVLIDEIDAHLHVAWQQRIGFWLKTRFPRIQFLVTTHSPFICQAASAGGIVRLPAPGETGGIRHVDEHLFTAITTGGADEAVISELFGLEHAHSDVAEEARSELATLERRILTGDASEAEEERYRALRGLLPDTMKEDADRRFRAWMNRMAE